MENSRRDFLKAAGITVIGLGGGGASFLAARGALGSSSEPEAKKRSGKRWALAIDTRRCAEAGDCQACMDACNTAHNVPLMQSKKDEIKWIWKDTMEHVFPERLNEYSGEPLRERSVLVLCNHCDNPPCVRVCPTQATWKSESGPVMMDQHRCIGCRYCVVGCPYGARSFNFRDPRPHIPHVTPDYPTRTRGVVEKCTMCAERLAVGGTPACVEACAEAGKGAIIFGDLNDPTSEIRIRVETALTARRKEQLGTLPQVYYTL